MFAAYGVSFKDAATSPDETEHFRAVVGRSGLAIAAVSLVGSVGVIVSKVLSWRDHQRHFGDGSRLPAPLTGRRLAWGVRTGNTALTLVPDVAIPIVFGVAWLSLI